MYYRNEIITFTLRTEDGRWGVIAKNKKSSPTRPQGGIYHSARGRTLEHVKVLSTAEPAG